MAPVAVPQSPTLLASSEMTDPTPTTACSSKRSDKDPAAGNAEASGAAAGDAAIEVKLETARKKKKKRGGIPKSKGSTKPSGFEEYVVDGPPTKEEADAENELYSLSKPFSQRIELCIQRYKARRKWDPTRLQMFTTYLALGGVATGQKQFFGGIDEKKMDDMDAEHIAMMAATDYIQFQDNNTENAEGEWEVDFAYVVRGFLSYKVPFVLGYKKPVDLELASKLIKNFLNYVVFHSVAPEYEENIRKAVDICNTAERELVLCANVSNRLPGTFNTACSTIYHGFYAGIGDLDKTWEVGVDKEAGFDKETAEELVTIALLKRGTPDQQAKGLNRKVVRRDYMSLEVTAVIPAPSERVDKGVDKTLPENKYFCKSQALGKLKVRPWVAEDPLDGDHVLPADQTEGFEIWIEKTAYQFCFVGMHLEARVHRFDDGLVFIDSVTGVMCSFYLRLENPIIDEKESEGDYD